MSTVTMGAVLESRTVCVEHAALSARWDPERPGRVVLEGRMRKLRACPFLGAKITQGADAWDVALPHDAGSHPV
ncbi:MAG: hypothetical protein AAFR16_06455, partial [Pseudomonadota bacterium]